MNHSSRRLEANLRLKLEGWRSRVVLLLCLTGFAILLGRAFYLQALNNDFLQAKGEARFMRVVTLPAARGAVTDRNGKPLAISTPMESVKANLSEVDAAPAQIARLAHEVGMDGSDLAARLASKDNGEVLLKRFVSPEQAQRVRALAIPGIFMNPDFRRFYPASNAAAHVIGITDVNDLGQEGIELAQQSVLAGAEGRRRVIQDRKGRIVEDIENLKIPREGKALKLSIDEKFQYLAYRELKAAVEANKAKGGALVMLDARTGEVLALVNQPDYNPNNRAQWNPKLARNRSITDVFEPGSTFKPFAVSLALETGIVKPETVITTGPGLTIGSKTITDAPHHSTQLTVAQVIQTSSNIGTAKIALQLPSERLWNIYSELGFGTAPKTGFPGEATGHLRAVKTWKPIEQATMGYGYGVSVSALQLARAYTIFTNDGVLLPVTFLKREGDVIGKQVISAKTARIMAQMLETVTQQGGTATKGQVPGYRVAGKTGTAEKIVNGQYAENFYLSSFVGFGPASNPRYIIAVTIDEPSAGKHFGGDVSAPVFSNVMSQALRMTGVSPDAESLREASAPVLPIAPIAPIASNVKERG